MPKNNLTGKDKILHDLIHGKCELWPACSCHPTLAAWSRKLDDPNYKWDLDELDWAEQSMFITLHCVSAHCPISKIRYWAKMELIHRQFDRRHRNPCAPLTVEICDEITRRVKGETA
jgi:hypothetical protein